MGGETEGTHAGTKRPRGTRRAKPVKSAPVRRDSTRRRVKPNRAFSVSREAATLHQAELAAPAHAVRRQRAHSRCAGARRTGWRGAGSPSATGASAGATSVTSAGFNLSSASTTLFLACARRRASRSTKAAVAWGSSAMTTVWIVAWILGFSL
jgi:hypothetical protein